MRPEKKKGTDQRPAPITQSNYNRLNNLCLLLFYGSMAALFYAHFKHIDILFWFMLGMACTSAFYQMEILYSEIEEEEDE